jgi:hypothetical protein
LEMVKRVIQTKKRVSGSSQVAVLLIDTESAHCCAVAQPLMAACAPASKICAPSQPGNM